MVKWSKFLGLMSEVPAQMSKFASRRCLDGAAAKADGGAKLVTLEVIQRDAQERRRAPTSTPTRR